MHDGVGLETRNRPTAVVVTSEFLHEAEVQRAALGMEALVPVPLRARDALSLPDVSTNPGWRLSY